MAMDGEASRLIEQLGLTAHPEGGHYREFFRSTVEVSTARGTRSASTAIWFLLRAGEFSAVHQVLGADEVWQHCGGDPLLLHLLDERGARTVRLGPDLAAGEQPLSVVPGGVLQAAEPAGSRFSLCACIVAPGFEFADFVLPSRAELCARHPRERTLIERLTRA
ncbi:MAG TPA: cupin domain-containing protein [Myxococcales bacterium]|nr:cupin domain-containing protein [Myxococcales bacterium]